MMIPARPPGPHVPAADARDLEPGARLTDPLRRARRLGRRRGRRDTRLPPGEEVADFQEYTHLYQEAWRDPLLRWLFSTLPSAMVLVDA